MKNPNLSSSSSRPTTAFTLIELLVVIAVIVVLAGLLFPAVNTVALARMKKVVRTELMQIDTAIKAYHAKKGFYPPDNQTDPTNPTNSSYNRSPLYFELVGTVVYRTNGQQWAYSTLDGTAQIDSNTLATSLGVGSIANSSSSIRGTDTSPGPEAFLKELRRAQIGQMAGGAKVLVCSEGWTKPGNNGIAPFGYNSSRPANNPGSYDLWVDMYIKGKTNRFSNWSLEPKVIEP